ncbi:MAG: DUF1592 domain-containing protein, partial [Planctomycetia bacterium]
VPKDGPEREKKAREFIGRFIERGFRRPLSDDERKLYVDAMFASAPNDLDLAVKRAVLLTMKSPRFLYREVGRERPDQFDVASRLSFVLWDSIPDEHRRNEAAAGRLETNEQVRQAAWGMVGDRWAKTKLRLFLEQWLKLENFAEVAKDARQYPGFDSELAADLRTSLDLFLTEFVDADKPDFRRLLSEEETYLNGRLAKFYGVDLPADAPFRKVAWEKDVRAGVLTHPYMLSGFAYHSSSSPIHRGVWVARSVLGRMLRPPPEAVTPIAPELKPDLNTRERVALQTSDESCMTCHSMINSLGFSLENFDAVGRFRSMEKGRPIDATGVYWTRDGSEVKFAKPRDLAAHLLESRETHEAFTRQLFQYMVKQPLAAYGPEAAERLRKEFVDGGFDLRRLMVEIAVIAATQGRPTSP